MVQLFNSTSVDDFVLKIIDELKVNKRFDSTVNPRDLFTADFFDFLEYAYEHGTEIEKRRIYLITPAEGDTMPPGHRTRPGDIKSLIYTVGRYSVKQKSDPILVMVHAMDKHYSQGKVRELLNETYGEGNKTLRASEKDIEKIGMVIGGCHAFPEQGTDHKVHLWFDNRLGLSRHSLYIKGTTDRIGFLHIDNEVYGRINSERMPLTFKSVRFT